MEPHNTLPNENGKFFKSEVVKLISLIIRFMGYENGKYCQSFENHNRKFI
jgi:hypothetical protein